MFIWGTRVKKWPVVFKGQNRTVVLEYSYFSLFFILSVTWNNHWYMLSDRRSEDTLLTYEQVAKLYHSAEPPKISVWERYGLLIVVGVVIVLSVFQG